MAEMRLRMTRLGMKTRRSTMGLVLLLLGGVANAQTFDSGSDGSDGALTLTTAGTIDFLNPTAFDPPLDPDGDGVYHFTTITIGADVTLAMRSATKGPIAWLASGAVEIDGVIDLDGADGHTGGVPSAALPGTGGYGGGYGDHSTLPAQDGNGPGGGGAASEGASSAGGAGHRIGGEASGGNGGAAYGNVFLQPLLGGSGGGGGHWQDLGGGGGAGGGALLIASSSSIQIQGTIRADGGNGGAESTGNSSFGGGGASGGALRLVAPIISGGGTLSTDRGTGTQGGGSGSPGWVRLEAFHQIFSGLSIPPASSSVPSPVTLPAAQMPVRVVRVGGVAVPATPTGSFALPDVTIDTAGAVTVDIEASGIPLGTIVKVTHASEDGTRTTVDSTALAGTVELSTATASVVIPHGLSRFFVEAMWTP